MQAVLHFLAVALAGLFAVATLVAVWEQIGRRTGPGAGAEPTDTPPRGAAVDVELDALAAPRTAMGGDALARRDALDGMLNRMARPGGAPATGWGDTVPMVGPSPHLPLAAPHGDPAPSSAPPH